MFSLHVVVDSKKSSVKWSYAQPEIDIFTYSETKKYPHGRDFWMQKLSDFANLSKIYWVLEKNELISIEALIHLLMNVCIQQGFQFDVLVCRAQSIYAIEELHWYQLKP